MVVLQTDGERAAFIAGMEFAWGHMADGGTVPDVPSARDHTAPTTSVVTLPGPTLADAVAAIRGRLTRIESEEQCP